MLGVAALRALAKRDRALAAEIREHDTILDDLTRPHAPTLREGLGIGADTAGEALIVFGDNPRACPLRSCFRQALRHQPSSGLIRHDQPAPTLTSRPS